MTRASINLHEKHFQKWMDCRVKPGNDDPLKTGHVICGNEFIHAELVKILKPLGK